MNHRMTTLERAYQLARSGECTTVGEIKQRLVSEHYHDVSAQLYGRTLITSLRKLLEAANAQKLVGEQTAELTAFQDGDGATLG